MKVKIPPCPTDKIWERTIEIIKSPETKAEARKEAKYFSRNRGMSFSENVIFVINKGNASIQTELNRFFTNHKEEMSISEQAFSKARNHYDESPFVKLFKMTVEESYAENSGLSRKYRGYYLFAIDGTDLVLPQGKPELREKYGDMKGVSAAQGSACYDILSERIVCAEIGKITSDERKLAKKHLEELVEMGLAEKSIVIFDRGYPSLELLRYLSKNGFKYLMRVRRKFNVKIDKIESDEEIEIKDVAVRAVKVPLNDDYETLITNLDWTPSELFELYGKRWGIETDYDALKNKIQVEAWSGLTETAVLQDFWASLYLNNLVLIEKFYADTLIAQKRENKGNKYIYKANINEIVGSIKDRFIDICFADDSEQLKKFAHHQV
jgi:predicted transcriptional regulator